MEHLDKNFYDWLMDLEKFAYLMWKDESKKSEEQPELVGCNVIRALAYHAAIVTILSKYERIHKINKQE